MHAGTGHMLAGTCVEELVLHKMSLDGSPLDRLLRLPPLPVLMRNTGTGASSSKSAMVEGRARRPSVGQQWAGRRANQTRLWYGPSMVLLAR